MYVVRGRAPIDSDLLQFSRFWLTEFTGDNCRTYVVYGIT